MESLQVLDQILAFFDTALNAAIPILDGNVRFLFQTFLVLSIVLAGATYAFGNTSVGLEYLLKKILLVGFMIFILTNWLPFTNIVINSFGLLGLQTGGLSTTTLTVADLFEPSRIAGLGVGLADQLLEQANEIGGLFSSEIGTFLLLVGASLVLALSFILIALQVFMLLIEFKLVTLGGFILLPFALLDRTTSLAQGALGYVIAASLKVFVIAVVVSFAIAFVSTLTLSEEITSTEGFAAIGVSLTFLLLAIRAPGLAASIISGGPSLGVGAIAQTVVTAAGAGAAAAYAGVAAARTGRAAGRIGIAGASGIARAGQAKGELQVQASNARLSPNANATAGRLNATASTATPTSGAKPSESATSKIRSDAVGAGRSLGRAGLAAGVAIPRSDGGGGSVKVDLSDRK
ncbi:MAG: P-type conjugative transfer protein TrbL [Pseudomonadota bacterium]